MFNHPIREERNNCLRHLSSETRVHLFCVFPDISYPECSGGKGGLITARPASDASELGFVVLKFEPRRSATTLWLPLDCLYDIGPVDGSETADTWVRIGGCLCCKIVCPYSKVWSSDPLFYAKTQMDNYAVIVVAEEDSPTESESIVICRHCGHDLFDPQQIFSLVSPGSIRSNNNTLIGKRLILEDGPICSVCWTVVLCSKKGDSVRQSLSWLDLVQPPLKQIWG